MTEVLIGFSLDGSRAVLVLPANKLSAIQGPCEIELHSVDGAGTLNNIYMYEGSISLADAANDLNNAQFPTYIAVANVNGPCRRRFARLPSMLTIACGGVRYGYVLIRQLGEVPDSRYEGALRQASRPMDLHR